MPDFYLLHASDLHLAAIPRSAGWPAAPVLNALAGLPFGQRYRRFLRWVAQAGRQTSHDPNVLRAFAQFVYVHQNNFDVLLLTGDMATTGNAGDLQVGYDFVTPAGTPNVAFLNPTPTAHRIQLLPGNHDRYRPTSLIQPRSLLYRPGGTQFDTAFNPAAGSQFWTAGQGVQGFSIPRGGHTLHVLMADFSLPAGDRGQAYYGLPGWFGQGRVGPHVLQQLGTLTQHLHGPRATVVWAIHFDPFTTDGALLLLDSTALRQELHRLQRAGVVVPAVLCGHAHESKTKPLTDGTTVFACGTTTQAFAEQGNDCQLVTVTAPPAGPATVAAAEYRYDGTAGQFLPL
jgi:3',5'-cyclic AMP phosphodiesterase CpdA